MSNTAPYHILLGDNPTLHTFWPDEPFRWEFDDFADTQPPGFEKINIGVDIVWAIKIDDRWRHPDYGDIIVYGENRNPIGIERRGVML